MLAAAPGSQASAALPGFFGPSLRRPFAPGLARAVPSGSSPALSSAQPPSAPGRFMAGPCVAGTFCRSKNCTQSFGVILLVISLPRKGPFLNHRPEPSTVHDTKNVIDKNAMNELGELLIHPKYEHNKENYCLRGW